jgi:chromate transporter
MSSGFLEVLLVFLKLGLTSFGGPIAHLGYFREEFVMRRRWLDDATYTDLVALCQFLPGPASSQVGFSIGLLRAGYAGALAAWVGFTLPSAIALVCFAYGASALNGPIGMGLLHGLKLVAVAIVAQAVAGMARSLCPDRPRASIAAASAAVILFTASSGAQIAVIAMGALIGTWLCRGDASASPDLLVLPVSRGVGIASLATYGLLLTGLPVAQSLRAQPAVALFASFYHAGALVFGGGHVVLPLLRDAFVTPGWVSDGTFLAGYAAAQAVPGPLFSVAAFLGAVVTPSPHGLAGAALGLIAIFLPGMLILVGTLPFWNSIRTRTGLQAAMRGINAAVVGLLAAALYSPFYLSSVRNAPDLAVVVIAFVLLTVWRASPLWVILLGALAGVGLGLTVSPPAA